MRGLLENKRGSEEDVRDVVIFLVLNTVFFVTLVVFVRHSASGAAIYEQAYAKKIALAIDDAKPGMKVYMDMSEIVSIAKSYQKKTNTSDEETLRKIVQITPGTNQVGVSLTGGKGYYFKYFAGGYVTFDFDGDYLVVVVEGGEQK